MPTYAIHNANGEILRVLNIDAEFLAQNMQEGEFVYEGDVQPHDAIDVASGTVIHRDAPVYETSSPPELPEYVIQRLQLYPTITSQLDMLWHAMDAGEIPKAGDFYDRIKRVKDAVPKSGETDPVVIYDVEPMPEAE